MLLPGLGTILKRQVQILQPTKNLARILPTISQTLHLHISVLDIANTIALPDTLVLQRALSFLKSLFPGTLIVPPVRRRSLQPIPVEIQNHRRLRSSHAIVLSRQHRMVLIISKTLNFLSNQTLHWKKQTRALDREPETEMRAISMTKQAWEFQKH